MPLHVSNHIHSLCFCSGLSKYPIQNFFKYPLRHVGVNINHNHILNILASFNFYDMLVGVFNIARNIVV